MKFEIGKIGVELLFSWLGDRLDPQTPALPVRPTIPVTVPVAPTVQVPVVDIRTVVYVITSAFEGGPIGKINFQNLTGNFDGQGFSIGFLQWCCGQASDRKLFQKLEEDHPGLLEQTFGPALYNEFMAHFNEPIAQRLHWAQTAVNNSKNQIEPNWKRAFLALCNTVEFQDIQRFYAEEVFQKAISLCREYGLRTNRAVCLAFDIITQNGSIRASTKQAILAAKSSKEKVLGRTLTEKEYLELIATKRAEASNPRWVKDVLSRKMTIVNGTGLVHGDRYDLTKLGLNDGLFSI